MKTPTEETSTALTPGKALERLKEGNARFRANLRANRDLMEQVRATADGQQPFAVISSCIDSRTSAELVFDQGLGDIFSIRVAGNVLNDDILGSMEFACELAGSKLIVVLGHSRCGAVMGACEGAELGHLTGLLGKIRPVVELVERGGDLARDELTQRVAEKNVEHVVGQIRKQSRLLDAKIAQGQVGLVGAMYCLESGTVRFQDMSCGDG